MRFQSSPWYVADFTIHGNGILSLVRLRLARRLYATIAEITSDFSDTIAELGTVPGGGPVSRELWLYSRYGALRFFRLEEAGLIEIDLYGIAFVNGKPVVSVLAPPPSDPGSVNQAGTAPVSAPGNPTGPLGTSPVTGQAAPGTLDPRGPIARWLRKRNASREPEAGGADAAAFVVPAENAHGKAVSEGPHVRKPDTVPERGKSGGVI